MPERSKLQSYLGFSIRAGKLVTGVNAIECTHKRIYALVMCKSAAKNTRKDAEKLRDRLQVPLCIADDLAELVKKENCKLCAMLDRSLAEAVIALFADEAIAPRPRSESSEERILLTSEEKPFYRAERNAKTEKTSRKPSARNTSSGERNGFVPSDGIGNRSEYGDRSGKPRSSGKYVFSDSENRKEFRKRTSDGTGNRSEHGDRSGKQRSSGKYVFSDVRERNASVGKKFGTVRNGTAKESVGRADGKSRGTFGNQTKAAGAARGIGRIGAANGSQKKYNRPAKRRNEQKES